MQISSNTVLSIVFLVYVDVFQPKWLLLVDVCSHVVVSCIFLPGGRTHRMLPSLLVRARGVDIFQLFKSFLLNICTSCGCL